MHLITDAPCDSTAYAIRDIQFSVMPRVIFNYIVAQHPGVLLCFTRVISEMMMEHNAQRSGDPYTPTISRKSNLKHRLSLVRY